jgi:hypothetical protein
MAGTEKGQGYSMIPGTCQLLSLVRRRILKDCGTNELVTMKGSGMGMEEGAAGSI